MDDEFRIWMYGALGLPAIIPANRQQRAAALLLADSVRATIDIDDSQAEEVFVPVMEALDGAFASGWLDDVLLGRRRFDLKQARKVRDRLPYANPVGRDVLAEMIRSIIDDTIRLNGRTEHMA
jgi:hypothetical protein